MAASAKTPPEAPPADRRAPGQGAENWTTAITKIEPNKIIVRGYPVDEMMGRVSFAEAIYLLLLGELPSPAMGRMVEALLVSSIDHGATPPSTLAARNVATTGAPLRASVAAGVLAFGPYHGGDIGNCIDFLDRGLDLLVEKRSYREAARQLIAEWRPDGAAPPGFGHRFHSRDPRAARLFQMALELELEGRHVQMIRAIEQELVSGTPAGGTPPPVNVDGAIAAICCDMGVSADAANALFIISRVPGIVAQALEERERQPKVRQIDPKDHVYDGPAERRLPETRSRKA
jgi:citrate synthase